MEKKEIVVELQKVLIRFQNGISILRGGKTWVAGEKLTGVYTMLDALGAKLQKEVKDMENGSKSTQPTQPTQSIQSTETNSLH